MLYPTYEDTEYLEGGTSYINILRCIAVLFLSGIVYFEKKYHKGSERKDLEGAHLTETDAEGTAFQEHFYFYLNLGALVLYVFCSFLPIISRIGYYLTVSHIFYLPLLLKQIEHVKWRRTLRAGVLLAAVLYFMIYMSRAGNDGTLILPYKTFFFHDMVNILSDVN